ncbi:MAG: hypothetical protein ABII85_01305 [Bacillota bacterium]
MKKGYSVFGKSYEYMFKRDLHHPNSVDHDILRNMVLIEKDTIDFLYDKKMEILDCYEKVGHIGTT